MIGLLLLKHIYGLSDEGVCERWVHDPYFQYFTGEEFFQHEFPHERSDLSHWRKRLGDTLELLLAESLRVAHASRRAAHEGSGAGDGRHNRTAQGYYLPDRRQAGCTRRSRGLNRLARKHGVPAVAILSAHLGRCYLEGSRPGPADAILTAIGHNLRLVLAWLRNAFAPDPGSAMALARCPSQAQIGFLTDD